MEFSTDTLRTDRAGEVVLVTLTRPEQRNAMSRALRSDLGEVLARANEDVGVRALVLTGSGSAFCAGMDLSELEGTLGLDESEHRADSTDLADLFTAFLESPKPVVAAVNGPAVAGGAGLVSVCDLAVMAASARIGYTEARIGFVAALVGVILRTQISDKHARDLLLSGRLVDAATAASMGLVNEVVPDGEVVDRAVELAASLARCAPGSISATKGLLLGTAGVPLREALALAVEVNVEARTGQELGEGVRAFLERRPPRWSA